MQSRWEAPTRPLAPRPTDDEDRLRTVEQLGVMQAARDDPHRNAIALLVSSAKPLVPSHEGVPATERAVLAAFCTGPGPPCVA